MSVTPIEQEPAAPAIPTGDEVYALLMGKIEPELMPDQIETLKEKYKDETPEQAAARSERYDKAFAEYDAQYLAYMAALETKVKVYQRDAIGSVEKEDRRTEDSELTNLEAVISSM
ncbi:MAG: hypothetical protein JWM56_456 [Candidatus Peribacteria bacterium]|nr:hypothetical protein [Candidatus Peribacteria bacterium]